MNLAHHTDEALMALMRDAHPRGETWTVQAAFDVLLLRHQDRINGRLRGKLPRDEADDATQEVFLALFDTVAKGTDIGHVGGWLSRVAANKAADFYRGKGGQHLQASRSGISLDDDDPDAPAHELRDAGEQGLMEAGLVVEQLLAARSAQHQAVVRLFVLEGRPAKEVTDATGESGNNVYKVAQRFRDDLRAALRGEDHSNEDRT